MKKSTAQKSLRPTTGKVREALFDILQNRINGARFLDLFAGTGAVGIEAIRKGASDVVFVEAGKSNVSNIRVALTKYHFTDRAEILTRKALPFIEWADESGYSFDLIFMDPPYHSEDITQVFSAIDNSSILADDGLVIAEHFKKRNLPEKFGTLQKFKDYKYGDTVLSFYGLTSKKRNTETALNINQETMDE